MMMNMIHRSVHTHLCFLSETTDLHTAVPSALRFISIDQMSLQIKIPYDFYTHDRLLPVVFVTPLVIFGGGCLGAHARDCQYPRSLALNLNSTTSTFFAMCNISFDECLCPLPSHLSTHGVKCMSGALIRTMHVVPLLAYVLQICTSMPTSLSSEPTATFSDEHFGSLPCSSSCSLRSVRRMAVASMFTRAWC